VTASAAPRLLPAVADAAVLSLPALVRGELVHPPPPTGRQLAAVGDVPTRCGDAYVVPYPASAADGRRFVVLPYADPARVLEPDLTHLSACLHDLPFTAVLEHVAALHERLRPDGEVVQEVLAAARRWWPGAYEPGPQLSALLSVPAGLFDPAEVAAAVETDLGDRSSSGAELLDGWVPVRGGRHDGMAVRVAGALFGQADDPSRAGPLLRAVPTRQVHVTAGNSPVIPALSLLRAAACKGAAVIKSPVGSWLVSTALALALHRLGRADPLTHHTSLVYWRGGDHAVEDVLFAEGAFDRVVVWGNAATIASVRARATARTVLFEPRVGMSLVGREAFDTDLADVLRRACADSLIDDQAACTASLVHYVEGDDGQVLRYCAALRQALARWDAALPHRPTPEAAALWRRLRREELVGAHWFINGRWPEPTSAVVYAPHPFDLSAHPMSRCVVVRRVDDLHAALRFVDRRVSAVGVWPPRRWEELRGPLAARGVTTVAPLGETERRWFGGPHDGMRVLAELVNWVVA
jgi:Acyl-CoA reductase (LuxC)